MHLFPLRLRPATLALLLVVFAAAPLAAGTFEDDFSLLVAQTDRVMSRSPQELQRLVDECDRLQPLVEALPESPRKFYRRRLEMTRKLFIFTLEAKENPTGTPSEESH